MCIWTALLLLVCLHVSVVPDIGFSSSRVSLPLLNIACSCNADHLTVHGMFSTVARQQSLSYLTFSVDFSAFIENLIVAVLMTCNACTVGKFLS